MAPKRDDSQIKSVQKVDRFYVLSVLNRHIVISLYFKRVEKAGTRFSPEMVDFGPGPEKVLGKPSSTVFRIWTFLPDLEDRI